MKNLFQDYSDKIAEFGVHDPAIIKTKGKYYTISTHGYFQIRESNDLIHWFDNKNSCFNQTTIQNELKEGIEYCHVEVPKSRNLASPFWAPDIIKIGSKYFLYYSISSFGSTQSFIGLAKSKNILGPYKNQGKIISSKSGGNIELFANSEVTPVVSVNKFKRCSVAVELTDSVLAMGLKSTFGNACQWVGMADVNLTYYSPLYLLKEKLAEVASLTYGTDEDGALEAAKAAAKGGDAK